jgi:glucokinase
MIKYLLGFDIGGTKCAVILGQSQDDQIRTIERKSFPTPVRPESTLLKLKTTARELLADKGW